MSHGLSGLDAETRGDQFVITPHRPIEKNQWRASEARFQFGRHLRTGCQEIKMLAACLVADAQSQSIPRAIVSRRMSFPFKVPGGLAGYGERHDLDAR